MGDRKPQIAYAPVRSDGTVAINHKHEPAPRPETAEVPVEPTPEMIAEGFEAIRFDEKWPKALDKIYRAMISARPTLAETGAASPTLRPAQDGDPISEFNAKTGEAFTSSPALAWCLDCGGLAEIDDAFLAEIASLRAQLAEAEKYRLNNFVLANQWRKQLDETEATIAAQAERIAELEAFIRNQIRVDDDHEYCWFYAADARALLSAAEKGSG